jgi:hypothetical protein
MSVTAFCPFDPEDGMRLFIAMGLPQGTADCAGETDEDDTSAREEFAGTTGLATGFVSVRCGVYV